jgi:hypothetical protein
VIDLLTMTSWLASLAILRDTPDRQTPEAGGHDEENTYGLPQGERLRRILREWFARQRALVLGVIPADLAMVPTALPDLNRFDDGMAQDVTPVLTTYWDQSGKATRAHLGLDPEEWRVTNPHLKAKIRSAAYDFCHATNTTTSRSLDSALKRLHATMVIGQATRGETLHQLTRRVNDIFDLAERWRARRIAATEASRAVHAAQMQAADESGVVQGYELLLSSDACPLCRKIATECKAVKTGQPFAVIGENVHYREVRHPPLHPQCQCAMIEILSPWYGGPVPDGVEWGETLDQPQRTLDEDGGYTPPAGKVVPKPEPERAKERVEPTRPAIHAPDKPIGERLETWQEGERIRKELIEAGTKGKAAYDAALAEKQRIWMDMDVAEENGQKTLNRLSKRMSLTKARTHPDYLAERAKFDQLRQEYFAANDAVDAAEKQAKEFVWGALPKAVDSDRIPWSTRDYYGQLVNPPSPELQGRVDKGRDWIVKLLNRGEGSLDIALEQIAVDKEQRAYHSRDFRKIALASDSTTKTAIHELGHHLEARLLARGRSVGELAREFLGHRVGNETPVSLHSLYPDAGYGPDEMGRKDKFIDAFGDERTAYYAGKVYDESSEILALGLEHLYSRPVEFAKGDPEFFKFVVGVLTGAIR